MNTARTLALAGALQAAALARQLAHDGKCNTGALHESVHSLLRLQADSAEEVFGGARGVYTGLQCIAAFFGGGREPAMREVLQYAYGCHRISMQLQNSRNEKLIIGEILTEVRAEHMKHYRDSDAERDLTLCANLATIYNRCIGRLQPAIIVRGKKTHLENTFTVYRIRAALFAGIRAAWLWRQLGGRRLHLLFERTAYHREAVRLLNTLRA